MCFERTPSAVHSRHCRNCNVHFTWWNLIGKSISLNIQLFDTSFDHLTSLRIPRRAILLGLGKWCSVSRSSIRTAGIGGRTFVASLKALNAALDDWGTHSGCPVPPFTSEPLWSAPHRKISKANSIDSGGSENLEELQLRLLEKSSPLQIRTWVRSSLSYQITSIEDNWPMINDLE